MIPERIHEFWSRVDKREPDDCWPWIGASRDDPHTGGRRGIFYFKGTRDYAYRVAWEIAHGEPIPPGMMACHSCDVPICVNPAHIFIGTARDNTLDAKRKGRLVNPPKVTGLRSHNATVPPERVRAIVDEFLASGLTQKEVAQRNGISPGTLRNWLAARFRPDADLVAHEIPKRLKPCGTRAAYLRHGARGEIPCAPCLAANAERSRQTRRGAA